MLSDVSKYCFAAIAAALLTVPSALPQARQDGRFIRKLEWVSPHGELPGTYAEYLRRRPLRPAQFGEARTWTPPSGARSPNGRISLLIDADLYPAIQAGLSLYVTDLTLAGYSVYTQTVSGGTPEEIKDWVRQQYQAGSAGMVFIGDITAAWAEVSGSVFPCDLFYMDLDGDWQDTNGDGIYDTHTAGSGDEGPEVYVARVYASTLTYDTESNLVNDYFQKAHAYRTGALGAAIKTPPPTRGRDGRGSGAQCLDPPPTPSLEGRGVSLGTLSQPRRGLEYIDEDWYSMYVALDLIYGDDVVRHDFGYFTTGADYLDQMDLGQHFVQVCAHSYSGGHHFGRRPTEAATYAHVYVHSPSARPATLWVGSDDGNKVWLNGVNVLTRDVYHGWTPDQYYTGVVLNAGWNRLLCKISQGGGAYQFSARLSDHENLPLTDLSYQLNDPDLHGADAPFIRGWLLNGFHQDISDNFWSYLTTNYLGVNEAGINPQAGDPMGGKVWTRDSSNGGFIDLGAYSGGAHFGACYAFVRVYCDSATPCQLWMGYDDGARVWLNGQVVLYDNRYGGFEPDMTKINVNLQAGENRLLVKISQWMGAHGFSARFCHSDGSAVAGLSYDPQPDPISYIGSWLLNGPYANKDTATRLTHDYLGGEADVRPSEGDEAPLGTWQMGISNGYPFDIGQYYDHGDWVFSQTIQDRDPPVLFYNLFACGPGRFTDTDYLAGAYIFNTTYGLITVASSKSGSMLNFHDFTGPLGQGQPMGPAFREWFDAQAPYAQWEREWYYGMILNGDPTLHLFRKGDLNCDGVVDGFDIAPFVLAITDPDGYAAAHPGCDIMLADCNFDGQLDGFDIQPFVELIAGR